MCSVWLSNTVENILEISWTLLPVVSRCEVDLMFLSRSYHASIFGRHDTRQSLTEEESCNEQDEARQKCQICDRFAYPTTLAGTMNWHMEQYYRGISAKPKWGSQYLIPTINDRQRDVNKDWIPSEAIGSGVCHLPSWRIYWCCTVPTIQMSTCCEALLHIA